MTHSGHLGHGLLHGARSCRSTTASSRTRRCAATCSARSSADMAEPLLPDGRHVGRDHDERQWGYGIFDYPMILDLLDAAGVSWKVYNVSWDSVPFGNTDNVAVFWENFAHDKRTRGSRGALPQRSAKGPAAAGLVHHPELRPRLGRAPAGERRRRDGDPGGARQRRCVSRRRGTTPPTSSRTTSTAVTSITSPPPAGRRIRARDPGPDVDHLAVGEARPHRAGACTT